MVSHFWHILYFHGCDEKFVLKGMDSVFCVCSPQLCIYRSKVRYGRPIKRQDSRLLTDVQQQHTFAQEKHATPLHSSWHHPSIHTLQNINL